MVRQAWILCVVFGAGVLSLLAWFTAVIPSQTCGGPQVKGTSAFLAYQLSRTAADIEGVFGQEGNPCRAAMIAALDLASKVDLILFIAAYSGFFTFFFVALMRSGFPGLARVGVIAVVVTLLSNVLETSMQLYITSSLPGPLWSLVLLTIGSTGKFMGFAAVGVCAGAAMLARGGIFGRVAGAACLAGGLMVVVGLSLSGRVLTAGSTLILLVIFLYAVQAAVRSASEPRLAPL